MNSFARKLFIQTNGATETFRAARNDYAQLKNVMQSLKDFF